MELKLKNLEELKGVCNEFPKYNIEEIREESIKNPKWIHFGAGNIFRGYIARLNQDLINEGHYTNGISVVEGFDEEIIEKIYAPYDNLTLSVTLHKDGNFNTNLIANLVEGLVLNKKLDRIEEIFKNKDLQIVSFTITEKGYNLYTTDGNLLPIVREDIENEPRNSKHLMSKITYLLYKRYKETGYPVTLLSLDNCSKNGDKIKAAVQYIAENWVKNGKMEEGFLNYVKDTSKVSYPWSMIDKITPRPAEEVKVYLQDKNIENMEPIITSKNTYIAPYVNSEEAEYLVIEDDFANGRPSLEKVGVYVTDRETVNKIETMKVTTCLNPLHTTLAIYGCLLDYKTIADEMKDDVMVKLIKKIGYDEALPVVVDPKIINPREFIDEVINVRLPNIYIPDTPQRIATDTSQKVAIRFGETIKSYVKNGKVEELKYIPLVIAGWFRYMLAIDDNGNKFELSPDPLLDELRDVVSGITYDNFGNPEKINTFLSNKMIFGLDLVEVGMDKLILKYLEELCSGRGAAAKTLKKYVE